MNSEVAHIVSTVAEVYHVPEERVLGKGKKHESRSMLYYVLSERLSTHQKVADCMALDRSTITYHINKIKYDITRYIDTRENYREIIDRLADMKIKLTTRQMRTLHDLLNAYLETTPEDIAESLIQDHVDDINETIRKRLRAAKEGFTINDKQVKAFSIWYVQKSVPFAEIFENGHQAACDVIAQLKPDSREFKALLK